MNLVDPQDFIIVRKRKKYRFAQFANSDICFEKDEWQPRQVDSIEIGAGNGLFSVELALRHPEKTYVAIDVKGDRLQKGARCAKERGLQNIFFIRARADQINELFPARTAQTIWITFADPFPKKGSAGRRLTHPTYLDKYQQLLAASGSILLKHDSLPFFCWSLEQLVMSGWSVSELSFDLHTSGLNEEYKIHTTYEKKWIDESFLINFAKSVYKN